MSDTRQTDWQLTGEPAAPRPCSKRQAAWHRRASERLGAMHRAYGRGVEGVPCRHCHFLIRVRFSKDYLKCKKAGVTSSEATDWRATWQSCGAYQRERT